MLVSSVLTSVPRRSSVATLHRECYPHSLIKFRSHKINPYCDNREPSPELAEYIIPKTQAAPGSKAEGIFDIYSQRGEILM